MWEISVVIGVSLFMLLFVLRTRSGKDAGDHEEQCQSGRACSARNDMCCRRGLLPSSGSHEPPTDSAAHGLPLPVPGAKPKDCLSPGEVSARSLVSVEPGRKGRVLALTGGREFQAKLVSMGFNVGSEVTVLKTGVGGSGLLVAAGDTRLAIGNGIAERIVVAVEPNDGPAC